MRSIGGDVSMWLGPMTGRSAGYRAAAPICSREGARTDVGVSGGLWRERAIGDERSWL
jgi:hypothetical protein